MSSPGSIHWHEGLFLQPHHLQFMQRQLADQRRQDRSLACAFPYGVIDAQLASDELANGMLRFDTLHAIMPSGREVRVGVNADLPALPVKDSLNAAGRPLKVYLAVPLWNKSGANAVDPSQTDNWRVKCLYRVREIEFPDENTGENPQAVPVRRINARLLIEGDDTSDLEILPLLRIAYGIGEHADLPHQDPDFIPPCAVLDGSPALREMVSGVASTVEANGKELMKQLQGGSAKEGDAIVPLLRLRTLSRFGARLPQLVRAPNTSPFQAYIELRELLAELAALSKDPELLAVPDYDHDEPTAGFREVIRKIRASVKSVIKERFLKIDFVRQDGQFLATLSAEHLQLPNAFFLAIKTKKDSRQLVGLVEAGDQFKLMAPSRSKGKAILGVELTVEHAPPAVFPTQSGLHYFRLQRSEKNLMWQAIEREKAMVVVGMGKDVGDFVISLYMTVPEYEEGER